MPALLSSGHDLYCPPSPPDTLCRKGIAGILAVVRAVPAHGQGIPSTVLGTGRRQVGRPSSGAAAPRG
jgi:hypothetical protein